LQIDPDSAATTVSEPAPGVLALVALSVLAALGRVRRF
jgi:MYXO-CTERM domain-containing protein